MIQHMTTHSQAIFCCWVLCDVWNRFNKLNSSFSRLGGEVCDQGLRSTPPFWKVEKAVVCLCSLECTVIFHPEEDFCRTDKSKLTLSARKIKSLSLNLRNASRGLCFMPGIKEKIMSREAWKSVTQTFLSLLMSDVPRLLQIHCAKKWLATVKLPQKQQRDIICLKAKWCHFKADGSTILKFICTALSH